MNIQNPLYVTGMADGKYILGGIFKMHDQVGFPVEASFEEAKRHGFLVDWLEALADCWLNDCLKFDSFCRQASLCAGIDLEAMFKRIGAMTIARFPKMQHTKDPVDVVCRYVLSSKKMRVR